MRVEFKVAPGERLVTPCALEHGPLHGARFRVPRQAPPELFVGLPDGALARYRLVGWVDGAALYRHDEASAPERRG